VADWVAGPVMRVNMPGQILAGTEIRQMEGRARLAACSRAVEYIGHERKIPVRLAQPEYYFNRDRLIRGEADPMSEAHDHRGSGGDNRSETGPFKQNVHDLPRAIQLIFLRIFGCSHQIPMKLSVAKVEWLVRNCRGERVTAD
jgi:hypothetical protein